MKTIFSFVLIFFSTFATQAQIENEKVVFSERGNLLFDFELFESDDWFSECQIERLHIVDINDSIRGLLKIKDSVYFEYIKGKDKKISDSIFCVNNKIQYKNKDTSFYPYYIYDKMSTKKFYKRYKFNQIGKLINNELEFKIDNIRDTIFISNVSTDNYKNPKLKIKSKLFNLSFIHSGKIIKKLNLPFCSSNLNSETTEKDVVENILDYKNLESDFTSFLEELKIELDSYKIEQNPNKDITKLEVFNYNKKYFIKFRYRKEIISSLELFHKGSEEVKNEKISGNFSDFIVRSAHYSKDNYFNDFFILD